MRGTRWLLLLAIVAVLGGSGYLYYLDKEIAKRHRPERPALLAPDTNATAIDYQWAQSSGGFASVEVKAKTFRQIRDTPNYDLRGLELRLNQKDHKHYDLIKSAAAQFNQAEGRMFSDGEVEITLDIPLEGKPLHQLTSIRTSGVSFDSKSGKASTDRHAQFTFENGEGQSTGAAYDPTAHELHLRNNPQMNLRGKGPNSKPMVVNAGEITYRENGSLVNLSPWSRMVRAETTIDAGPSVIFLNKGHIDNIDSDAARGVDQYPNRQLRYSADKLHVTYDNGEINHISATGNARMHEESSGAVTDTHSNAAELSFAAQSGQSVLQHVTASGNAVAESKPAPGPQGKLAESRILKSDTLEVHMRPGGREIDQMSTRQHGTLEFVPNAADQHRRVLESDSMVIGYGPKNLIHEYHATHASTVTFPAANTKAKNASPAKTASAELTATFDDKGQLAHMTQWPDFTYESGDRRARAVTAHLDQQANAMDLETSARIWDTGGATNADKIHLLEKTGDYLAEGHVMTSRLPDQDSARKKAPGGEMLEGDEPIQGSATHMSSANHNKLIHYEGGAVLWQGSDRVEANVIEIDRDKHLLTATGNVITQFLDKPNEPVRDGAGGGQQTTAMPASAPVVKVSTVPAPAPSPINKAAAAPVYTVVTSDKLIYTDATRLAHYNGNVILNRPGLNVKSADLQAWLNPKDSKEDSRLNHAISDGKVEITESAPNRQRVGRGDHGEYTTAEDKVVLRGNLADLYDSIKKDESHGTELTYFTSNDRLLITGAPSTPVASRLHRKPRHASTGNR